MLGGAPGWGRTTVSAMAVVGSSRTWRLVVLSVLLLGAMGLYELRVSQLDLYRPGSVHHVSLDTGRREG